MKQFITSKMSAMLVLAFTALFASYGKVNAQSMNAKFTTTPNSGSSYTVRIDVQLSTTGVPLQTSSYPFTVSNTTNITALNSNTLGSLFSAYTANVNYSSGLVTLDITEPGSPVEVPTSWTELITLVFTNTGTVSNQTDLIWNTPTLQVGLSQGTFIDKTNDPLSIKLTSFTVDLNNGEGEIGVTTASELNNDYINIERSPDGKKFEVIGTLKGQGTTMTATNYSFLDKNPLSGISYYRITQFDFDGKSTHSDLRVLRNGLNSKTISIFPNPTTSFFTVNDPEVNMIQVCDISGRVIFTQNTAQDKNVSTQDLTPGIYLVKALDSSGYSKTIWLKKSE